MMRTTVLLEFARAVPPMLTSSDGSATIGKRPSDAPTAAQRPVGAYTPSGSRPVPRMGVTWAGVISQVVTPSSLTAPARTYKSGASPR